MLYTTTIEKIRNMDARKHIIQGGSSSGKTYAILAILIDYAIRNKNKTISVVSETMPHLRRGALRDFINIMTETNRYVDEHYNKSNLLYTFASGSIIEFFSADSPGKLKGARRDVLFINECNNVTYEAYQQLSIRTKGDIYLDYNPDRTFWAITDIANEQDAQTIILSYKDNEALDANIINEFKQKREKAKTSEYWKNWCKVYIDGEVGSLQGAIFDNWQRIDIIPDDANFLGCGLDFGFTNDPTACVAVYKYDNKYIIDEIIYQKGLLNNEINNILNQKINKNIEIWADSAEPKTIRELKNYGWKINGANKGKDSVNYGLSLMQQSELLITSSSINLINELENYLWLKDKDGTNLNIPIDAYNHAIDAARYFFISKLKPENKNKVPFFITR